MSSRNGMTLSVAVELGVPAAVDLSAAGGGQRCRPATAARPAVFRSCLHLDSFMSLVSDGLLGCGSACATRRCSRARSPATPPAGRAWFRAGSPGWRGRSCADRPSKSGLWSSPLSTSQQAVVDIALGRLGQRVEGIGIDQVAAGVAEDPVVQVEVPQRAALESRAGRAPRTRARTRRTR